MTTSKPGDHPDFFRFPSPPGTSRESSIRLDHEGRFWHEGALVEHPKLAAAMHSWITRHPDDGRFILSNGYDWTYFAVDTAPFFVVAVSIPDESRDQVVLTISDGSQLPLVPDDLREGSDGALSTHIDHKGSRFEVRFTRHAQSQLAPWLDEDSTGRVGLRIGDQLYIPAASVSPGLEG